MKFSQDTLILAALVACSFTSLRATENAAPGSDSTTSNSASEEADLAKQINNPVAALISVPFQANDDFNLGPTHEGYKFTLNVQPVIPISIGENWNLIIRTIVPFISQRDLYYVKPLPYPGLPNRILNGIPPSQRAAAEEQARSLYYSAIKDNPQDRSQDGLGDMTQSFFFSPKGPGPGGIIAGFGPVFLYPTATQDLLGGGKWGMGPTFVALKQTNGWTVGMLANQIWSIGGESSRSYISSTFLQPFIVYTTNTYTSIGLNTESTYNWQAGQWTVPLNLTISQVFKIAGQPMSLQLGARYYAESPSGRAIWGMRINFSLLFPLHNATTEMAMTK